MWNSAHRRIERYAVRVIVQRRKRIKWQKICGNRAILHEVELEVQGKAESVTLYGQ